MEPLDDRIARRRAEIAEQQAALDRQAAQRRSTDNDDAAAPVVERRQNRSWRTALFLILLVVAAAGLFGLAVTLTRLAGADLAKAQRQGNAQVTSCGRLGPITNKGFGYWDRCTATITWDDASTDRVTVDAIFTSVDIGTQVRVADLGNYRTAKELARTDT